MWKRRQRVGWPSHATTQQAIRYLASVCDGAVKRDGHGFGSDHADYGHWLAALPDEHWGINEHHHASQLIRSYQGQLSRAGFDVRQIRSGRRPRRVRPQKLKRLTPGWGPDPSGLKTWRW